MGSSANEVRRKRRQRLRMVGAGAQGRRRPAGGWRVAGLLEDLQQRIRGSLVEFLGTVDDDHAPTALAGVRT